MIVGIEINYDHSSNKKMRYDVYSDGYLKGKNLSMTKAKQLKSLLQRSITTRQKLRKLGVTNDR